MASATRGLRPEPVARSPSRAAVARCTRSIVLDREQVAKTRRVDDDPRGGRAARAPRRDLPRTPRRSRGALRASWPTRDERWTRGAAPEMEAASRDRAVGRARSRRASWAPMRARRVARPSVTPTRRTQPRRCRTGASRACRGSARERDSAPFPARYPPSSPRSRLHLAMPNRWASRRRRRR